jgi:hypothetical protein
MPHDCQKISCESKPEDITGHVYTEGNLAKLAGLSDMSMPQKTGKSNQDSSRLKENKES